MSRARHEKIQMWRRRRDLQDAQELARHKKISPKETTDNQPTRALRRIGSSTSENSISKS